MNKVILPGKLKSAVSNMVKRKSLQRLDIVVKGNKKQSTVCILQCILNIASMTEASSKAHLKTQRHRKNKKHLRAETYLFRPDKKMTNTVVPQVIASFFFINLMKFE